MKQIFLLSFIFVCLVLSAQDKVITVSGDTILCRIISISDNHIVYEPQIDEQSVSNKTIPIRDVADYFRAPNTQSSNGMFRRRPWLFNLSSGVAFLPWPLENEYYKGRDKGFTLNTNVHYLIRDYVGLGLQCSFFMSGYIRRLNPERLHINYVGLSAIFRQYFDRKRKLSLSETLSGGFLLYHSKQESGLFPVQNFLITGNTFGATVGISLEYKLLPYFSIGMGGSFMYGKLSKANFEYKDSFGIEEKIPKQELENPLNLSRFDCSLFIRFHL